MRTIAVISQKGGVGKTTIAVNLAIAAEVRGLSSVLLDLDPQASSTLYGDKRESSLGLETGPAIISLQSIRLQRVLSQATADGNVLCLLDTPPHSNAIALDAAKAADLVLVPCCPSYVDLEATKRTIALLDSAGKRGQSWGIVSMSSPTPSHVGMANELSEALSSFGLAVAPTRICRRAPFVHAGTVGEGVVEMEPKGKASEEVQALLDFVLARLSLTSNAVVTEAANVEVS